MKASVDSRYFHFNLTGGESLTIIVLNSMYIVYLIKNQE